VGQLGVFADLGVRGGDAVVHESTVREYEPNLIAEGRYLSREPERKDGAARSLRARETSIS